MDEESDDDFHQAVTHRPRVVRSCSAGNRVLKSAVMSRDHDRSLSLVIDRVIHHFYRHSQTGRHFLDEEAELSEDDEEVSSDEDDGDEQNHSLDGFVVNTTQCSQGLNGETGLLKDPVTCLHSSEVSFVLGF